MTGNFSAKSGESTNKRFILKEYYANLRVAAGPTHAGFTAGVRWIGGEYRRGRSRGVLLHCHANVQNGSIGAAANSETAGDIGEHAKADRDSPEFFVLRRVNESRRGSACDLGSAGIPAHPRPTRVSSILPMCNFRPERGFWRSAAGVG